MRAAKTVLNLTMMISDCEKNVKFNINYVRVNSDTIHHVLTDGFVKIAASLTTEDY